MKLADVFLINYLIECVNIFHQILSKLVFGIEFPDTEELKKGETCRDVIKKKHLLTNKKFIYQKMGNIIRSQIASIVKRTTLIILCLNMSQTICKKFSYC